MAVVATRMIDTIGQNLIHIKGNAYWNARPVLSYTTRSFAATAEQRAWFAHFVGIDQAPTNALFGGARIKDVENGGALNSNAAALADAGAKFVAYTFEANIDALRGTVARSRHPKNVRYFVADWNLNEAQALQYLADHDDVVAVQWASPTVDGRMGVPGTSGTLSGLNVDLSVGLSSVFLPSTAHVSLPQAAEGIWSGVYSHNAANGGWAAHGIPGRGVKTSATPRVDYAVVAMDMQLGDHKIRGIDRETGAKLLEAK